MRSVQSVQLTLSTYLVVSDASDAMETNKLDTFAKKKKYRYSL